MSKNNYRLTVNPAMEKGNDTISFTFPNISEMEVVAHCMSSMLLFLQDELKVMSDLSNTFITEEYSDGEWEEVIL